MIFYKLWRNIGFNNLKEADKYSSFKFKIWTLIGKKCGYLDRLMDRDSWMEEILNEKDEVIRRKLIRFGNHAIFTDRFSDELDEE